MQRRPNRIVGLAIYGIFVGLWNLIFVIGDKFNISFLIIGLICIFMSFCLFMLRIWGRIIVFIFSLLFVGIYIIFIVLAIMGAFHGFDVFMATCFYFPTLILSLLLIDNLRRKEIKAYFK